MRRLLGRALVGMLLTSASVAHASGARAGLATLLSRARLVVTGQVADVTAYDNGRITVARLQVDRRLQGETAGSDVLVVERHDLPSSPQLLRAGEHALVFLVPAARSSSLRAAVPAGTYYEILEGRSGVLSSGNAADVQEAAAIVARLGAAEGTPLPQTERRRAARKLVFDEIAARHALVVANGVDGLAGIRDLASTLSAEERQRLEAALERTDLPGWVRVSLVRAVADRGLVVLVPALRALPAPTPELQRAAWDALVRLGASPSADDLKPALTSADPAIRATVPHALLASRGASAIPEVTALALDDPDRQVRRAAIESLGESRLPEALPSLERAFASPDNELRQAAGRAIYTIGGRPALETFARLAFEAPPEAQTYAVVLLFVSGVSSDDPLVERIRTTHPDERVRHIATEGLELHDH